MSDTVSVSLSLTNKDKDIIAWLNMLVENECSPSTWIQALILSDICNKDLDIGKIYLPPDPVEIPDFLRFDDDEPPKKPAKPEKKENIKWGWSVRGENNEFIVGSICSLVVTRPIMLYVFRRTLRDRRFLSKYIKVTIRKHLVYSNSGQSEPPRDPEHVEDIFILYEPLVPGFQMASRKPSVRNGLKPPKGKQTKPAPSEKKEAKPAEPAIATPAPEPVTTPPQKPRNPLLGFISQGG